jgi:DNA segregation ATPase FtsK/SpoIIIE-like protein
MAMRDILDRQANSIEYVLHTHGIRARIDGGRLSPRLSHFHIVLPLGVSPSRLAPIAPELADALGVVSCRLSPGEDGVYVEVPRPDPVPVRLLPLVQRVADVIPPVTATLGLDTEGTPLLLRLNSPDVDPVIISGNHGSGKSSLLRGIALSLALHNSPDRLRLLLLDCTRDGSSFLGLESLPHLACPPARGPVECLVSLRWALRTLARNANTPDDDELLFDEDEENSEPLFEHNLAQAGQAGLVVMIDGIDELCATGNRRADVEAIAALNRLFASGSRHNIYMVATAERPDQIVGVNAAWGARITGSVSSPELGRVATSIKGSGAQALLGGGDFLIALNAELIRFQAGAVSQVELARAVELIATHIYSEPQQEPVLQHPPHNRNKALDEPVPLHRSWVGE